MLGLALLAFATWCAASWSFTMDDAFISFRYARNLAAGLGPIWNPADAASPVEGYTSLLHVVALALLHRATGADLVLLGKAVGTLCGLALVAAVAARVRSAGLRGPAPWVALSFALLPYTALHSVSGMETSLFAWVHWSTFVAALHALERGGRGAILTFVGLGLAGVLIRPESGAAFLGLAVWIAARRPERRRLLAGALAVGFVLPLCLVTVWRLETYGDWLPNAFHVKHVGRPNLEGLTYTGRFLLNVGVPYLLIAGSRLPTLWRRRRDLAVAAAITVGVPMTYFTLTDPLMGWWYRFFVAQIPILAYVAAVSLDLPGDRVRNRPLAVLGLVAWSAIGLAHVPMLARFLPAHRAGEAVYRELGRRLRPFAAPDRWLWFYDVGSVVYESDWNTFDAVGLNTRAADLPAGCEERPDLIVRSGPPGSVKLRNPCPSTHRALGSAVAVEREDGSGFAVRIFGRRDRPYLREVEAALRIEWPPPYRPDDPWLTAYWVAFRRLLFQ